MSNAASRSYSVLIVEDEPLLARNMQIYLERCGVEARAAASAEAALLLLDETRPDVVVLDYNLPGRDGLQTLAVLREREPGLPVVITTGHGSEQVAVAAMKGGAFDYLIKPVSLQQLRQALERAVDQQRQRAELRHLRAAAPSAAPRTQRGMAALLGESPAMRALRDRLGQIVNADLRLQGGAPPAVLICGETGTGKELVARALHFEGPRRDGPFVEINCASLPTHLVESELFGHERGAFTDARERRVGLVEAAVGGTLFLDEVGELEPATQAKLLKLLEDRRIRRLGSVRELDLDVRVLAATNRPLEAMVAEGRFRADLFYRLGIVRVDLPPLRARTGDVRRLAEVLLARSAARYAKPALRFTEAALARLEAHPWPGNVRELANLVEQCVILAVDASVEPEDLPMPAMPWTFPHQALVSAGDGETLPEAERRLLQSALERCGWNVSQAARSLGISRDTLRYRIDKFQLRS